MNDITALAQRMKAAAEKAITEEGIAWWDERLLMAEQGPILHEADAKFIAATNPAKVLALVEALEKAQQQKESDFEIKARLCKESNGLHDRLREAEKRIAELESRTVTVTLPAEYLNADGSVNADMANTCPVVSAYREAHRAAGIQVIEGEA